MAKSSRKAALAAATALQGETGAPIAPTVETPVAPPPPPADKANEPIPSDVALNMSERGFATVDKAGDMMSSAVQLVSWAIVEHFTVALGMTAQWAIDVSRNPDEYRAFRQSVVSLFLLRGNPMPTASGKKGSYAERQYQDMMFKIYKKHEKRARQAAELALVIIAAGIGLNEFDRDAGLWNPTARQYAPIRCVAVNPDMRYTMIRSDRINDVPCITAHGMPGGVPESDFTQPRDRTTFIATATERLAMFAFYKLETVKPDDNADDNDNDNDTEEKRKPRPGSVPADKQGDAPSDAPLPDGSSPTPDTSTPSPMSDSVPLERNTLSPMDQARKLDWQVNLHVAKQAVFSIAAVDDNDLAHINVAQLVKRISPETLTADAFNDFLQMGLVFNLWLNALPPATKARYITPTVERTAPRKQGATRMGAATLSVPTLSDRQKKAAAQSAVEVRRAPRKVAPRKQRAA